MTPKIILITGAGRGIGFETARQLHDEGHTVLLGVRSGRTPGFAPEERWLTLKLDVTRQPDIDAAADFIQKKFGRLDVLINNAGIGIGNKSLDQADVEEVKSIFDVNFYGPMRMNISCVSLLKKSDNARIINVSSQMGALAELSSGYAGYRLSKAGLNAQTMLLANELRSTGIRVVSVCPGWVKTDMGGAGAPRPVTEGAAGIVWLATSDRIETGSFYHDREVIPW
ncbi:MAG: SDR family NAD(P)-dependent oxidoreductase [Bacteroidetes bacterium]|nr:SDR family NAD(P)-dependent oxidoreductase [Bacteroidota bacterium]